MKLVNAIERPNWNISNPRCLSLRIEAVHFFGDGIAKRTASEEIAMRERKRSVGGKRRRSGGDEGPDLFAQELSKAVEQAFQTRDGEGGMRTEEPIETRNEEGGTPNERPSNATLEVAGAETRDKNEDAGATALEPPLGQGGVASDLAHAEPVPARMLNEFVYCPRLFYYEHVEGRVRGERGYGEGGGGACTGG